MIIRYTTSERDLLARLMRAEALGEGNLGMLMVGNVLVNRVLADCLTFKNIDDNQSRKSHLNMLHTFENPKHKMDLQ